MNSDDIKIILEKNPNMQDKLFARGFCFTDMIVDEQEYPFFGKWKSEQIGKYRLLVNPKQKYTMVSQSECTLVLIGHAYNPFQMVSEEVDILNSLIMKIKNDQAYFWNEFNELTGLFTLIMLKDEKVYVVGDPTGMQTTFYTYQNGKIYISSHTNLLGDLLQLEWDPYIKRLSKYPFFHLLGNYLPGNLTQFKEVKRLVPNHFICFDDKGEIVVERFFWLKKSKKSKDEIVNEVSRLLHNNMQLISEKWKNPAISLTGGCDSKTTLACTNDMYSKFSYFSYTSSEAEDIDAKAASMICEAMGLEHKIYKIPQVDSELTHIDETRALLLWNTGNIIPINENDVRKRRLFADTEEFDVEVKSWASEIGRAYYSKRFAGRRNFGKKPTPRACTTLYKFFLHNRKLVKETDEIFKTYLKEYFEQADDRCIDWQEQFFWEFRVSSWNGLVITGEHRYSFDITIPYNNRYILEMLLSVPIKDRIEDNIYSEIRKKMNPIIDKMGISITNLKHTKMRARIENIYYIVHTIFA